MKCFSVILLSVFLSQSVFCSYSPIGGYSMPIRCPTVRLNNGKIRVRSRGRVIRFNCNEGFTLVGNKYSTCIRGQWDTPVPVCVNAECPELSVPPHSFKATKLFGAIVMFFCEPGYTLVGNSEIYCNGQQWNASTPICRNSNSSTPTKCDFEEPDLCWWEQDPQHDFDWRRHNFETPSLHIGTGPTHDHTLGAGNDGHYLYIEASGRLVNDTARIISPLYNYSLTASGCFSFWYHMYGATIGSLNIYFKQEDTPPQLMFTKSGNQGNQWFHGIFDLPKSNINFQIIIEGVRGSSYVSDIAIDDVAILQGDECIVKNESIITTSNYDQVEIVNAQQTCRNRCVFFSTESSVPSDNGPLGELPEICLCTIDCAERSICCPDYAEYCILADTTTTIINNNRHITRGDIPIIMSYPEKETTLIGFSINPKDDIDPGVINSKTSTTRRPIKTTIKIQTRKPQTTSVKPTQQVEEMPTKETPFEPKTIIPTTEYIELHDRPDLRNAEQNQEKVKYGRNFEVLEIVAVIGATLCALFIGLTVTIIVIKRRKSYKKGANGSALSEDSDVRFLTSDEILDFNLARPTDNDEL